MRNARLSDMMVHLQGDHATTLRYHEERLGLRRQIGDRWRMVGRGLSTEIAIAHAPGTGGTETRSDSGINAG